MEIQLLKELISINTEQKRNRLFIIFKKWFTFFNDGEPPEDIWNTLKKLTSIFLKKEFRIRIIDLEMYIIKGEHLSFNLKESLFKTETRILLEMIRTNMIVCKTTDDLNFENVEIVVAKVTIEMRRQLCKGLIEFYKKYFDLYFEKNENFILK